ncbi:hypothetical protein ACWGB8_08010 [Kitasatospora sp. NPDC054939]
MNQPTRSPAPPISARQHLIRAAELVVRTMLGQDPRPAAIVRALEAANVLRTDLTVYRAELDARATGLYVSRSAAAAACEAAVRRLQPYARLHWAPINEQDPSGYWALYADGVPTDRYTCPVPVAATAEEIPC